VLEFSRVCKAARNQVARRRREAAIGASIEVVGDGAVGRRSDCGPGETDDAGRRRKRRETHGGGGGLNRTSAGRTPYLDTAGPRLIAAAVGVGDDDLVAAVATKALFAPTVA
jgi:hypothetical protein